MENQHSIDERIVSRAEAAVIAVLPNSVELEIPEDKYNAGMIVNGQYLNIKWAGKGYLGDVRRILGMGRPWPDVIAAQRMSPGARKELADAGISWVDETGSAEIAIGLIVVSRMGMPSRARTEIQRWTPSVMAIVEAIFCGAKPTVSDTEAATGLSEGSCTNALRFLTQQGLLESEVKRGPRSARKVVDQQKLLDAYVRAVETTPSGLSLQVGLVGRDPVSELVEIGARWSELNITWASTGLIAANVIAPYITSVTSVDVYVSAKTIIGLEAIAIKADLRAIEGGRLTLRPFPTITTRTMSRKIDGLQIAPWPRIYADLLHAGVRGEDAADHLLEVIRDR